MKDIEAGESSRVPPPINVGYAAKQRSSQGGQGRGSLISGPMIRKDIVFVWQILK
jgi:hypothetical protein